MQRARAASLALIWLGACAVAGCAENAPSVPPLPSKESFVDGNVSLFLERRCGSLDCHGHVGRPLRIYSRDGLRLGDDRKAGTTDAERSANYYAVVGLEPEELSLSFTTKGAFFDFLLLKKPLDESGGGVKHKGGPVLRDDRSDNGWLCLRGWTSGQPATPEQCKAAADALDAP